MTNPTLDDFLAAPPPRTLRNTHYGAVALATLLIGMASVLKIDIVVSGTGRLAADAPTIVLQPMQLSRIEQIRVKPGDTVHKGDVLATLDPTFAQADRSALIAQRDALAAKRARTRAELDGTPFAAGDQLLEATLYRQRQSQYAARIAEFDGRLISREADIAIAEQNIASLTQQLSVAREVETMRETLYRGQTGSKLNLLESQAARMRTERDLRAAETQRNDARQAVRTSRADRQDFADTWRRELLESLVKLRADAAAIDEALTKATRLTDLVSLIAPEDGVVLEVAKRSVGSVLHEAEPLVTLVPANAALIAEVAIGSSDVGYATAGDPVVVKVDAFPYQRFGMVAGHLRSIGEDSFAGPDAHYHRGQIALESSKLRLIPGMTVTAEIKVGSRSVLSYFLYPITRALNESIREP
jgi:hemolysin D